MDQHSFGTLIVINPGGSTVRVGLNVPALRLGRSESCDVVLSDPKISRTHLELTLVDGCAHFLNVSRSSKPVFQGKEVNKAVLEHGQTLSVGDSRLFYLAPGQAQFGEQNDEATAQTEFGAVEEPYEMTVSDQSVARLVIVRPLEVREIKIRKKELMVGRSSKADITVDHEKVSRLHCRLLLNEKDLLDLEDLGSTNGTLFQGANVKKAQLRPNQSFTVGDAKIVFKPAASALLGDVAGKWETAASRVSPQQKTAQRGAKLAKGGKRPVIVIPGFLGSELQCNGQVLWPRVKDFLKNPEMLKLPEVIDGLRPPRWWTKW